MEYGVCEISFRSGNKTVEKLLYKRNLIFLSVINVEEIFCGLAAKNAQRQMAWFEEFIENHCEVLPITHTISKRAGTLCGDLRRRGEIRTQADLLIASTALEYDLILATRNVKDFTQCGLVVHNPFES